jgi:uncharacterized protein YcbK (DUF882 family)
VIRLALLLAITDPRVLWLRNVHTGEELRIRPFGRDGIPLYVPWGRANHLFRSWRSGEARPINPRLLRVLAHVQERFGGRRIELVSGYRVPDDRDHLSSYHQIGRGADLFIFGISNRAIFDLCRSGTLGPLGCGLYPTAQSHVHIDVRSRPGVWVDLSRNGEPAIYLPRAREWIERHPAAGAQR